MESRVVFERWSLVVVNRAREVAGGKLGRHCGRLGQSWSLTAV
jgi:hypothetical protein